MYGDMLTKGTVLRSERFRLTGKPDLVTRKGREIIPYEYKSGNADTPRSGHMLQMGVYFLLLEDLYHGSKIPFGILKYNNSTFRIENTYRLKSRVLAIADEIRSVSGVPARNHDSSVRCFRCPYKDLCSQNLTKKSP
ncbi:MAG: Dna2/Cas4 domain-containing protein [Thermoplasmataceae archaeon]